ncbi:MAG: ribosome recycling factor [Bacillariaceae sp.]|jgi:ribosome recycling factor
MKGRCLNLLIRHGSGRKTIRCIPKASSSLASCTSTGELQIRTLHGSFVSDEHRICTFPSLQERERGQKRWKHAGKIGHKIETLKDIAHRPERDAAQERRQKKKDRKAAKKGVGGGSSGGSSGGKQQVAVNESDDNSDDDDGDDIYFDDDDDDFNEGGDENKEPSLPDMIIVRSKMDSVVDRFKESLKSIQGAEPTADMFDDVTVQAYGASTPLNAVAQVVITSPTLAQITCFDPSLAKDVVKAVQLTLELNPQLEEGGGGNIKVPLPRVSMEVREKLSKSAKKRAESCKQRLRGVRRKAMDIVKKGKDGKIPGVSKDDAFSSGKEIEAASEATVASIDSIVTEKIDSIMSV